MKPILVTSGEPAGVGPDVCLGLAAQSLPVVVAGDKSLLAQRARMLGMDITFVDYQKQSSLISKPGFLNILSLPCRQQVTAGILNVNNAAYVLQMLELAVDQCLKGHFSALVTAPVHKANINQAGFAFTGHTEFLASRAQVETVVMMLACSQMKVALATTHVPLKDVAGILTQQRLTAVLNCLHSAFQHHFHIKHPAICIAGLNPHAGEDGYLGREETEIITPVIKNMQEKGMNLTGPLPADTMFSPDNLQQFDVFLAMYHDQGLPVLKYAGFKKAVNVTLGLPFIRTSVDHGTALELAGRGKAQASSLLTAVDMAAHMAGISK